MLCRMSQRPWPPLAPEHRWTLELMEERVGADQPDSRRASARAKELRVQAAGADLPGFGSAALALAERYDEAAAARLTSA